MRVLYVDDDPIMTSAVVRMLDSEGFTCDTADLGKAAVDLAKENKYDIILLDVMLPDIDGYEVIKRLRSAGLRTPVLLQSGLVDRENDFEGLWLGASEYLLKPFNKTELVERIEAVLSRSMDDASAETRDLSDPSIPTKEVENQRRRHRRFETVQPGKILGNGGIDCLIMDMSYGGAALQLSDPEVELPETFDLKLQSGSTLRCSVRWRSGERVGVQGEALFSDAVITEVLKQGDAQSGSTANQPETPDPSREPNAHCETPAAAQPGPSPISEPQSEQVAPVVPRGESLPEPGPQCETLATEVAPAEASPEQSNPPSPDTPAPSEPATTLAETRLVESADKSAAGDAHKPEAPPVGAEAVVRPDESGPLAQPEAMPANDLHPEPNRNGEAAGRDDCQVFTVDRGARLVTESCECEELVIDGHLETAARARRLRLGREGCLVGSAEVELAEIRGRFEGNLVVTGRLVIFPGASVSGTTRYRQIVIEAGGGLMGQAQLLPPAPADDQAAAIGATPPRAAQA